jgi:hypothetical protein
MEAQTKNHQTVATVTCKTQDFIVGSDHPAAANDIDLKTLAARGSV